MIRCGTRRSAGRRRSAAFTLIEVLIALGLSVLLISAIYAAIDLHYRVQSVGRGEIAGNQLLRSLVRLMTEDMGSVVIQLPEQTLDEDSAAAESTSTETTSTDSSDSTETSETPTDTPLTMGGLEEGVAPLTFGLVGTATALHLTVSKPSRDMAYLSPLSENTVPGRASDSIIISYGLAPVETERVSLLESPTGHPGFAFARRILDLYTSEVIEDVLDETHAIAPEIVEVSFRYFDGAAWVDSWDSQAVGALPTSVEVIFGIWIDPPRKGSWNYQPMQRGTITPFVHRFHLPASVPFTDAAI